MELGDTIKKNDKNEYLLKTIISKDKN